MGIIENQTTTTNNLSDEIPFTTLMLSGRNELYQVPFDEFDPHHRISGKKSFNESVKCLQSKIDLSIT